jgi:hypothetical protein
MFDYWIKKISSIPDNWFSLTTDEYPTDIWTWIDNEEEAAALYKAVKPFGLLIWANDGIGNYAKFGSHPKERILNFLRAIEANPVKYHYPWD